MKKFEMPDLFYKAFLFEDIMDESIIEDDEDMLPLA